MKSKLRSYGLRAKSSPAAFTVLMWFVALLYWEIMLHVVAFGGFHWRNFYMLGFTALIAVLASLLCTMFPRRINRIVFTVLLIVAFALYTSQLIYLRIFGSFYSVSMMQMGGKALQSFWKETSSTVSQNILLLLAMLVPVIASFFAKKINPRAIYPAVLGGVGCRYWGFWRSAILYWFCCCSLAGRNSIRLMITIGVMTLARTRASNASAF